MHRDKSLIRTVVTHDDASLVDQLLQARRLPPRAVRPYRRALQRENLPEAEPGRGVRLGRPLSGRN